MDRAQKREAVAKLNEVFANASFPLDQPPFPGVIQTGEYHMEVRVFDTATQGLIYLDEDVEDALDEPAIGF